LLDLLKVWGFEDCQGFYSARQAIEAATSSNPAAMIIDIAMPDVNGFELAKAIRQSGLKNVLLIAISGFEGEEYRNL
jgi:YesN/AraC family two-component response regulator